MFFSHLYLICQKKTSAQPSCPVGEEIVRRSKHIDLQFLSNLCRVKLRSHAYWLAYGYGIRIRHMERQLGIVFTCTRLHEHGYISTACPQFHSLSHLTRTFSMTSIFSKLYNYMLQQDEILVKILYLYRQIKKKKKANNMRSMWRWWIHQILLKREEHIIGDIS